MEAREEEVNTPGDGSKLAQSNSNIATETSDEPASAATVLGWVSSVPNRIEPVCGTDVSSALAGPSRLSPSIAIPAIVTPQRRRPDMGLLGAPDPRTIFLSRRLSAMIIRPYSQEPFSSSLILSSPSKPFSRPWRLVWSGLKAEDFLKLVEQGNF